MKELVFSIIIVPNESNYLTDKYDKESSKLYELETSSNNFFKEHAKVLYIIHKLSEFPKVKTSIKTKLVIIENNLEASLEDLIKQIDTPYIFISSLYGSSFLINHSQSMIEKIFNDNKCSSIVLQKGSDKNNPTLSLVVLWKTKDYTSNLTPKNTKIITIHNQINRVGSSFDIHKLVDGLPLYLGGLQIPYSKGLEGHSDGDCILHAITDAIFGALNNGDLGTNFGTSDPKYYKASSSIFLLKALEEMKNQKFYIINVDIQVLAEKPRLAPHYHDIASSLADLMKIDNNTISIRSATCDKLGIIGEEKAIGCLATILLGVDFDRN